MRRVLALLLAALLAAGDARAQQSTNAGAGGGTGGFQIIGQGYPNTAITGVTTEQNVAAVPVAANAIGPGGSIRVTLLLTMTNNANTKTVFVRLNTTSGATSGGGIATQTVPSVAAAQLLTIIRNNGATNAQTTIQTQTTPFGSGTNIVGPINIDTTQPSWVNIGIWPAVGTDTITLIAYTVELLKG
jgi:hypothetical protein